MGIVAAVSEGSSERAAEGIVMEVLPSALVRVRLEGEHELIAHLPSSQRANFVRLRVGDRVRVALSATDRTRGRVLELLVKGQV
ncbi:MAG TPA: TOBE domain-containing protein [Bryobacteraceae bacterium]|nr:TOBE domain-containing protein [Bryobacteraceae bacterium]